MSSSNDPEVELREKIARMRGLGFSSTHSSQSPSAESSDSAAASHLSEALRELSEEGTWDSRSGFTLSEEKAVEKLASFQLPTTASWILVLVQVAVRAGASRMKITQSNGSTTVAMLDVPDWSWDELRPYLSTAQDDGSFLSRLAVCLRAISGLEGRGCEVQTSLGSKVALHDRDWVEASSGLWARFQKGRTEVNVTHLPLHLSPYERLQRRSQARQVLAEIRKTLLEGAFAAPVPITVDGLEVNDLLQGGDSLTKPRRLLGLLPLSSERGPRMSVVLPKRWHTSKPEDSEAGLRFRIPEQGNRPGGRVEACSALTVVYVALRVEGHGKHRTLRLGSERSEILWLRDGVVVRCDRLDLAGSLAVRVLVNASELETDLTGFNLRRDAQFKRRKDELVRAVHRSLTKLFETAKQGVRVDAEWHPIWTAVGGGLLMLGSLALTGSGFLLLFTGGIGVGTIAKLQSDHLASYDKQLDLELETLPERWMQAIGPK